MTPNPFVSVVTGTYNRFESLKRMVKSVRDSVGVGIPYEIIVVDGGSTDGSLPWLREQPDVVLIEQGELLGIVKAFDAGFKIARGVYVIIGNDDIEFRYESIQNSIAYMQDHPEVGIGCFPQNRYSDEYTVSYMPAVKKGIQVQVPYGQVCIIPKWLGDHVGWWGTEYMNYGGDNEISCNVWEMGYKVVPLESCCINDYRINDKLREKNSMSENGKFHPDSIKWLEKWTHKDGLRGPIISSKPFVPSRIERLPRLVYAPIYDRGYSIQLKTKNGLRKALAEKFLVSEINYLQDLDSLYYAISMFMPDVVLIQFHDPKDLTYDFMMKAKDDFPNTKFVSWNGDYHLNILQSRGYKQVAKLFDLATFACADIAVEYELDEINYKYWQIGYEEYKVDKTSKQESYDVVFLGNCYDSRRTQMGQMLRYHKDWKTGLFGRWPSHLNSDGDTLYDFAAGDLIYRSSKIAISDNLFPDSLGYVSNRLFQALHAGAFVLQQKFVGMTEFLGLRDGTHLVLWENLQELEQLIYTWLPRYREREQISKAGKAFVDRNHSFSQRVSEFEIFLRELKK